jgi:cysteine desulfurase
VRPIYLDYNATTPLDPRVFEAMQPYFLAEIGNAGSRTHLYGNRARDAVERSRAEIAALPRRRPEDVVFTSGATESNNLALFGLRSHGVSTGRNHVLATSIEHKSVLGPLEKLGSSGFEVEFLPVTAGGWVEPEEVRRRLRPNTLLVSMMHANNETGVLQPVSEIAGLLADSPTLFHVDAAQTFGKQVEELRQLDCDFLSISGHKIYGPAGVGALCIRRSRLRWTAIEPLMRGGGQERGLRPGTLPVPLIVGLGAAAELAAQEHEARNTHAAKLRRQLLSALLAVPYRINGDLTRMQPHVLNVSFLGVQSEALMLALRYEMAISNGSACSSSSYSSSHVLRAMGFSSDEIESSVRISWGPGVERIPVEILIEAVMKLTC